MGITVTTTANGIPIVTTPTQPVHVTVPVGKPGVKGDKGEDGADALWTSLTQAEYDALQLAGTLDPNTLYVIVP